jgi:hypothetical protein
MPLAIKFVTDGGYRVVGPKPGQRVIVTSLTPAELKSIKQIELQPNTQLTATVVMNVRYDKAAIDFTTMKLGQYVTRTSDGAVLQFRLRQGGVVVVPPALRALMEYMEAYSQRKQANGCPTREAIQAVVTFEVARMAPNARGVLPPGWEANVERLNQVLQQIDSWIIANGKPQTWASAPCNLPLLLQGLQQAISVITNNAATTL